MKNETKTAEKDGEFTSRITLRFTEDLDCINDVCSICGVDCDRDRSGYYYFLVDTEASVCDVCAESNVPELAAIRREAICFVRWAAMGVVGTIIVAIDNKLKASDEGPVVKYINDIIDDQYDVLVHNYEISKLRYPIHDVYGNC
jgi:hypothetical protein